MPVFISEEEDGPHLGRSAMRLLQPPKMHYIPKLSLPQLLANYAQPRDKQPEQGFGVVPGSAEDERKRGTRGLSNRRGTKAVTRLRTAALSREDSPLGSDRDLDSSGGWPICGGGLGALKKAQELFETDVQMRNRSVAGNAHFDWTRKPGTASSNGDDVDDACEFVKKRREHPRLRWPRLASRGNPVETDSDWGDNSFSNSMQSLVSGAGGSQSSTAKCNQSSVSFLPASAGHGSVLGLKSSRPVKTLGKTPSSPSSPSRPKGPFPRPAILPRVRSKAACRPGTASTLHAPLSEDEGEAILLDSSDYMHNSQTSLFGSSSDFSQGFSIGEHSSSSHENRIDRKWFMRMTPISCLPSEPNLKAARRAIAEQNGPVSGDAGEYLNFKRWGINDDYVDALLTAHCENTTHGLSGVHFMNLSENQLTEHGVAKLLKHGVSESLMSLNLAENRLGQRGGLAVISVVEQCRHLADLDLSGNSIGDAVLEELSSTLELQCHELEGLSLARCNLGTSPRANNAGDALGRLVRTSSRLKSLDLHWNMLNSTGIHSFLQGLYDNGMSGHQLRQLNLAWNRLGSGLRSDDLRKQDALRSAKLLASVFHDGQVLFHLDLSYNGFDAEECEILAKGLKNNHTLFGLHLIGNEATIDDLGFVAAIARTKEEAPARLDAVPATGAEGENDASPAAHQNEGTGEEVESLSVPIMQAEEQRLRLNGCVRNVPFKFRLHGADVSQPRGKDHDCLSARSEGVMRTNPSLQSLVGDGATCFSEGDLQTEQRFVEARSRVQAVGSSLLSLPDSLERNCKCCWICENWVEHKVCYIPGLSGPERHPEEVQSVHAFYSIDGFSRPIKLSKTEENQASARHSMGVKLSQDVVGSITGAARARGRSDQATQDMMMRRASRRASRAPGQNNKIVKWVGIRMLPPTIEPVEVVFLVDGRLQAAHDCRKRRLPLPKTISLKHAQSDTDLGPARLVQVTEVNVIPAGTSFWQCMQNSMTSALCVLEDPINRNEFTVFPRKLAEVTAKTKLKHEWTFENSSFKDFRKDNDIEVQKCFDTDWSNCRLNQILKEPASRKAVQDVMRASYLPIMLEFQQRAFMGFDGKVNAAGVSFIDFREWLGQAGGVGPGKLIDGVSCKMNDPDCIFIASNVIDRSKRKEFKVMPEKGLARFQFQEALVRVAFRRFLTGMASRSTPEECKSAVEKMMDMLKTGQEMMKMRTDLHTALFTEECCMVCREHMESLKAVYDGYKTLSAYPGRIGKFMSYGAWMEFTSDSGLLADEEKRDIGWAFALAKEIRTDVVLDWRHMELSFAEFLIAVAGVLSLRKEYCKEFLADMLEEAFCENIPQARTKVLNKKPGKARNNVTYDPSMMPLVSFLGRMFQDADDDGSGTVDQREFRRVFGQPEYKAEMGRLGVNVSELEMLFRTLDKDGSGELTLDVLCDGFIKMKQAMKGIDRAISYIRKAFSDLDENNSGSLGMEEFRTLFAQPGVLKKLSSLGISADDVAELLNDVDKEGQFEISITDIIEHFVKLRDPKNAGLRGVRLLEKLFVEADADESGELSKEEVQEALGCESVAAKLQKMRLRVPDWSTLFEELDLDGSGGLSWDELADGMRAFWAKDTLSNL